MKMLLSYAAKAVLVATVMLMVSACVAPLQFAGGHDGYRGDQRRTERYGPARAKQIVREVIDPDDIPEPFVGCIGSHKKDGVSIETERRTSFSVTERNKRRCPEVQLNFLLPGGELPAARLAMLVITSNRAVS